MRHLVNLNVVLAILLASVYWTAAYFLDFWTLHEIVSSLVIGLSAAVMILFGREAWAAFRERIPDRAYQLVMGIVVAWGAVLLNRAYHLWWRGNGQRIDLVNNDMVTFFSFVLSIAAILHLTVPGAIDGRIPKKQWAILSGAVGVGIALAAYLMIIGFGVDISVEPDLPYPQQSHRSPSSGDQWIEWLTGPPSREPSNQP
jgi:hypothetical protein